MGQKKILTQNDSYADSGMRLNKYLSDAGLCSRRQADQLIADGKIKINGIVAQMGQRVFPADKVSYNGKDIFLNEELILIAFHKPRGIECTTDLNTKNNVIDYIHYGKKIFYVGRLDKDSRGLLLLTNDGNLADMIAKSVNNHEKEYIVRVNKKFDESFLEKMRAGVPILDTVTKKCKVTAVNEQTFKIVLTQGLNRQIRRMCSALGYKVVDLKRLRVMNIKLGNLKEGTYRNVSKEEYETLIKDCRSDKKNG